MTRRLSINNFDSRCEPGTPVALIDWDNSARIVSQHKTLVDAMRAKVALTFDKRRAYGDPALRRFPIGNRVDAQHSLAAVIDNHEHWTSYSKADYGLIVDAIRASVAHFTGVVSADDSIPYGPVYRDSDDPDGEDDDDDEDTEDDPDDDGGDDGDDRYLTPYSVPTNTLVSNRSVLDGELELRAASHWPPAVPADRRRNR